jgi:hypothetical protein
LNFFGLLVCLLGSPDGNKALISKIESEKEHERIFVHGQAAPKGSITLSPQAFNNLATEVRHCNQTKREKKRRSF